MKVQTISVTNIRKPLNITYHKLTPYNVSEKKWDTEEVKDKSMTCIYCDMPKGTCLTEVTSNSEKVKPVNLAITLV